MENYFKKLSKNVDKLYNKDILQYIQPNDLIKHNNYLRNGLHQYSSPTLLNEIQRLNNIRSSQELLRPIPKILPISVYTKQ